MTRLVVGGLILDALLALAARWTVSAPRWLLAGVLAAFVPYLVAVWRAPTIEWKRARWWILGVALLGRLVFLPAPLRLSDDAYRYLWEGRVQRAGFSPYRLAPEAPELDGLRDGNWERVTHREVPSAYPPLLLLLFRGVAATTNNPTMFKDLFAACDLLTLWLLVALLRRRGQNESLVLIWAWNPLVILEFPGHGHEMSLAIACFVAGLWLVTPQRSTLDSAEKPTIPVIPSLRGISDFLRGRIPSRSRGTRKLGMTIIQGPSLESMLNATSLLGAGAAFGAAIMSHLMALPLVLAVVVAARMKSVRFWAALGVVVIGLLAGFADAGSTLLLGLMHFAGRWRFNGSLFELLARCLGDNGSSQQVINTVWFAQLAPKWIVGIAWCAVLGWTWWRRYPPTRAALVAAAALLVLSPVVHPWYVTWLVALVCLEFRMTWLAFSGLVIVSYAARLAELETGLWQERSLVRWLEYGPLYLLLAAEWWRSRSGRHDSALPGHVPSAITSPEQPGPSRAADQPQGQS